MSATAASRRAWGVRGPAGRSPGRRRSRGRRSRRRGSSAGGPGCRTGVRGRRGGPGRACAGVLGVLPEGGGGRDHQDGAFGGGDGLGGEAVAAGRGCVGDAGGRWRCRGAGGRCVAEAVAVGLLGGGRRRRSGTGPEMRGAGAETGRARRRIPGWVPAGPARGVRPGRGLVPVVVAGCVRGRGGVGAGVCGRGRGGRVRARGPGTGGGGGRHRSRVRCLVRALAGGGVPGRGRAVGRAGGGRAGVRAGGRAGRRVRARARAGCEAGTRAGREVGSGPSCGGAVAGARPVAGAGWAPASEAWAAPGAESESVAGAGAAGAGVCALARARRAFVRVNTPRVKIVRTSRTRSWLMNRPQNSPSRRVPPGRCRARRPGCRAVALSGRGPRPGCG